MSLIAVAVGIFAACVILALVGTFYAACVISSRCARLEEQQESTELAKAVLNAEEQVTG